MRKIKKIAVLGSGVMGIGIGISLASCGYEVMIWNHKDSERTLNKINKYYDRLIEREEVSKKEVDSILNRIYPIKDLTSLENIDLVIESIIEDGDLKRDILLKVESHVSKDVIIVTNTSTIKVEKLASTLEYKGRFAGLHFFNPVSKMNLVEIIKHKDTDIEVLDILIGLVKSINKEHVIVNDSPGFIVNRLLMSYLNNSVKLLEQSISNVEDIDKAMKLGTNNPMGPLELCDLIGVDVVYSSLLQLYKELDDVQYKPNRLLSTMVSENKLGRKTKIGFYKY